jgi:hypothetical protein
MAAACGRSADKPKAAAPKEEAPMASGAEMMMQPGADDMKTTITSPGDGAKISANEVPLVISTSGFADSCATAGKPVAQGQGHYHVLLDKSLVNMFCTSEARISMQNVKPGMHTLLVMPAQNDHVEIEKNEVSLNIDYQPASPLPEIKDEPKGTPSVKILEPKPGTTLSGPFTVKVQVSNFELSCPLYGKPAVAGYGHWHLNFDSSTGPMMGMGTMAGMSCERTFSTTTEGLKPGSTHTLIAILVDNGHAPLHPAVEDKVEVKIA